MTDRTEPILTPDDNRFVMFPIVYNDVWKMYKKQVDSFWRPEEIELNKDLKDWRERLTEEERTFISMILAFFSASDGIVLENLAVRFMGEVQVAEIRAFYGMQIFMENIHSEMYSLLIDAYIQNKEKKDQLLNATRTIPSIKEKADWAQNWINDKKSTFATRLVAFAVVEGIFFSSSFASIYWLKKRGLMPGLTLSNEFISRDEALHCEFAILLYSKLQRKLSKNKIHKIIDDAVTIEKKFICESISCKLIGMNAELMCQYIEFVADRLIVQLGYDKKYGVSNPFDFMELISIESKVNFFERTNSAYALADKSENTFDLNEQDF
jgi:ribonucleotide reductase beta subunit family protein with ferritin-like domain